jgi:hypothetical protein
MACTEAYATVNEFANFWSIDCTEVEAQVNIEAVLDITATNIFASLAAVGACDCALASWADNWLKKLNILEAGVMYNSRCGRPALTDEAKRMFLEWTDHQLELIRTSAIEVCQGHTGADWPSIGWASQALTERNAAEIIANAIAEEGW